MKKNVVLSVWGSPASTAYLQELARVPGISIQPVFEKNEKLFQNIQRITQERFGARAPVFESPEKILPAGSPLPVMVENLQSPETLQIISSLQPDWILLAGSGIVKEDLLKIPKHGALNCHPGILPRYRGCTCVEWAIYEDEPVGATCHFVTPEIDAGDIVLKETMPVLRGETYLDMRLRMFYFCAKLMAKAVDNLVNRPEEMAKKIERFDWSQARYYKPIPEEAMAQVLQKLEQGTYAHLGGGV